MPFVRQTNFLGGELNPELWGRTDLPVYQRGVRTLRNFFVTKSGAAKTRPGSILVKEAKSQAPFSVEAVTVRLIPFIAGDALYQSYVLELGAGYIRFHTLGGTVESAPGVPLEVIEDVDGTPPPWGSTSVPLSTLKYAQVGDVMTLVAPGMYPMELKRLGHTSWRLSRISFDRYQPAFKDVGRGPYSNVFDPAGPPLWPTLWEPMLVNNWFAGDADHPAREWIWAVTAIVKDRETGRQYETKPQIVTRQFDGINYYYTGSGTTPRNDDDSSAADGPIGANPSVTVLTHNRVAVFLDKPVTIKFSWFPQVVAPEGADTYNVVAFNYYRGRGGLFGWIGQSNRMLFVDVGDEPDYSIQPPLGTDPFRIVLPARFSDQHPFSVAFFEERRWFGGAADPLAKDHTVAPELVSTSRPATLFGSETGDYSAFDQRQVVHVSGEAVLFELATSKREEIRHLVPRERLLVLTSGAVRSAGGGPDSPIDFDSIQTRVEEEIGATDVVPVIVDGAVIYVRAKGNGVRALIANGGRYQGVDVSQHAQHLFLGSGRTIVDWTFQEDPWGVVWAVREDGELLSLTLNSGAEAAAWSHHDTDGHYESICAVPEGDEDAVYATVVRHDGNGVARRLIERFTSRVRKGGASTDTGGVLEQPADDICLDSALQFFGDVTDTFAGLDHLEGKEVSALVPTDTGMELYGPFTVAGGEIVFPDQLAANLLTALGPKLLLYVGLVFEADFETLDVSGDARLRQKTVVRVGLEIDESRGITIGQDFDHLDEWDQRNAEDDFNTLTPTTGVIDMAVDSDINNSARAAVRVSQPFPVTVVGIVREISVDEQP